MMTSTSKSYFSYVPDGQHRLARFIPTDCMNHRYMQDAPLLIMRMGEILSEKHQGRICFAAMHPSGVGLLIAAV